MIKWDSGLHSSKFYPGAGVVNYAHLMSTTVQFDEGLVRLFHHHPTRRAISGRATDGLYRETVITHGYKRNVIRSAPPFISRLHGKRFCHICERRFPPTASNAVVDVVESFACGARASCPKDAEHNAIFRGDRRKLLPNIRS